MGVMKSISGDARTRAAYERSRGGKSLKRDPIDFPETTESGPGTRWVRLPPGPTHPDLAPVAPRKASAGCLDLLIHQSLHAWIAVATAHRFSPGARYSRWDRRRGAMFLHRRIYMREARARGQWVPNLPLHVPREILQAAWPNAIVNPLEAWRIAPLDGSGAITEAGLRGLGDEEFVWPYLDTALPDGRSEIEAGLEYEKLWPGRFIPDEPAPFEANDIAHFSEEYAMALQEIGRAAPGTPLVRWLQAWSNRAEAEYRRIDGTA